MKPSTRLVLGAIQFIVQAIFPILIFPLAYIARLVVVLLAKLLRPDFDQIIGGVSAVFSCDLLAETPPRSAIVATSVFQNPVSCDEVKSMVLREWIQGNENEKMYKKFQQYPVNWLGFCFWRNAFHTFFIDNHVYSVCAENMVVTDDMLEQFIEKLMNAPFEKEKSPWELHVIENYEPKKLSWHDDKHAKLQSVILCKFHHTLGDGFSIVSAVTRLFDNQRDNPFCFPVSNNSTIKEGLFEKLQYGVTFPLRVLAVGSELFSNAFIKCPWRVPDDKKKWNQLVCRADPIPLQTIKTIKNKYQVGFTSVLLSAISSAIYNNRKTVQDNDDKSHDSVLCMNLIPVTFKRSEDNPLDNQIACVVLDIPKGHYESPLERLKSVDTMLRSKYNSPFPFMTQMMSNLVGSLTLPFCQAAAKNEVLPFVLSNVPGPPGKYAANGNPMIDSDFHLGGGAGVVGVVISAYSHDKNIRISITVEEGLMTRAQAKQFVRSMLDEIQILYKMASTLID